MMLLSCATSRAVAAAGIDPDRAGGGRQGNSREGGDRETPVHNASSFALTGSATAVAGGASAMRSA